MLPSEIIDRALTEVIPDESRWTQDGLHVAALDGDDPDKSCLLGALGYAAAGSWTAACAADRFRHPELETACSEIERLIGELHGDLLTFGVAHIPTFNDNRTYPEVRALAEKARANLAEQGY